MSMRLMALLFALITAGWGYYPVTFEKAPSVIAFGSCNDQSSTQEHWAIIAKEEPDLWIWTGDAVYADTSDPEAMRETYNRLFHNRSYRHFRETTPVIGTWDDHDYGRNNAGKEFPIKEDAQQIALDFFEEPPASARRKQEGIYTAYTFGEGAERVKIILIDDRYHAERERGELLGETQTQWLLKALRSSDAAVNIIVSGIQVLAQEHRYEKWADFPRSRKRLFEFIKQEKIPGVLFISGDRHLSEISRRNDLASYPVYDVTVSGLTHSYSPLFGESNRYRVGELFGERAFGVLRFDWEQRNVTVEIHDMENTVVHSIVLPIRMTTPE